jgi:hypothetical protein
MAAPARAIVCALQSGIVEDWDEDAMEDSSPKVPFLPLRPSCVFGADAEYVWDKLSMKYLEECPYYYILLSFRHTTRINSTMNEIEQSARQASIDNGVRGSCASSSLIPGSTVSCTRSNDPAAILQDLFIAHNVTYHVPYTSLLLPESAFTVVRHAIPCDARHPVVRI